MQMLPARPERGGISFPASFIDDRMNAGNAWPRASRFHRVKRRDRAAQEPAVFRLPPGVDDDRLALADDVVVPPPHRRLDGFAHSGHMFEAMMVLPRLVRPGTTQRPYRGRRGMKDIDVELFGDAPRTPCVGIVQLGRVRARA